MWARFVWRSVAVALWMGVASITVSCTTITESGPDGVSVDTGDVGDIVPGARQWLSWAQADNHCASQGKESELIDLKGSVVQYRCVPVK